MITDKLTMFCDGTALNTGAAGSYLIGSQIDIGNLRDIANMTDLYLVIQMAVTATSGGSATAQFQLRSDDAAAINVSSGTLHVASPVFPVASMAAGTKLLQVALPLQGLAYERYLGIVQVTGTTAFTAGAVDAFLTPVPQANVAYPDYSGV